MLELIQLYLMEVATLSELETGLARELARLKQQEPQEHSGLRLPSSSQSPLPPESSPPERLRFKVDPSSLLTNL